MKKISINKHDIAKLLVEQANIDDINYIVYELLKANKVKVSTLIDLYIENMRAKVSKTKHSSFVLSEMLLSVLIRGRARRLSKVEKQKGAFHVLKIMGKALHHHTRDALKRIAGKYEEKWYIDEMGLWSYKPEFDNNTVKSSKKG